MEREVVLFVGVPFVGKEKYLQENYYGTQYQIVSLPTIQNILQQERGDSKALSEIVSIMTKSFMSRGLPIVAHGNNVGIELIQSWKRLCTVTQYKLKIIMFEPHKEDIFQRLKETEQFTDEAKKLIENNIEVYDEIKSLLSVQLKHQKMADDVVYIDLKVYQNTEEDKK